MERSNIKTIALPEITKIFFEIEHSICQLDIKCNNIQISRALSIMHEALSAVTENRMVNSESLLAEAYSNYP